MKLAAHTVNKIGAMVRLLIGPAFLLLFFVTSGYGQTTMYSDIWAIQNGDGSVTVIGAGVTDDTVEHGYQDLVEGEATLTGPNGSDYRESSDLGYVEATVWLSAVEGEYEISSWHYASCGGWYPSAPAKGGISIFSRSYERQFFVNPYLAYYTPCNPGGVCRRNLNISTNQTGGTLPPYVYVDYISFSAFGGRVCFVSDVDPTLATTCPPDPL